MLLMASAAAHQHKLCAGHPQANRLAQPSCQTTPADNSQHAQTQSHMHVLLTCAQHQIEHQLASNHA
jgi:CDP-diacylglycerol pyrophosphatase